MTEGNRRTPVDVTLKFSEFSENRIDSYDVYTFYISADNYLELPMDANVRLPSEKAFPYKEMVKTLESDPSKFFLQNGGISVIASDIKIDKKAGSVKMHFSPDTGVVNGGHTQLAILNTKKKRDVSTAMVKMDVIKHSFTPQELAVIAASRNTASNVKPYSTAEKKGLFLKIRKYLIPEFEKHIIWYENRVVPNNRGMSAIDFIALLNLFNVKRYQSDANPTMKDQPNKSATSKASVFKDWESDTDAWQHVYPLVNDLINLMEHVQSTFQRSLPKGFTRLDVVKNVREGDKRTIYTGKKLEFELPKQFLLPLIASLRANIKFDDVNGKIGWFEKPEDAFDRNKIRLIEDLLKTFRSTYHNEINRASKDSNLWRILYSNIEQGIDKEGEWKTYDTPR
ncbi:AIPR family protein [Candidatus Kaiserbacteria bacterium]|nr:AIPR family protein [Candidatus Kaiserbacteria bacterium]